MPLYDPQRLAVLATEEGLQAVVTLRGPNVFYLSRYRPRGTAAAVVTVASPERPVLILPAADLDYCLEEPDDRVRIHPFGTFVREVAPGVRLEPREERILDLHRQTREDAEIWDRVAEVLKDAKVPSERVLLDSEDSADAHRLGSRLPGSVPPRWDSSFFRRLRRVKTSEEIERLERAVEITEASIQATAAAARPGMRQRELVLIFSQTARAEGAEIRSDHVSLDRGAAFVNQHFPEDRVRSGSLLRFDVGVKYRGYQSDMARCFSIGIADEKAARYHEALAEGLRAGLRAIRPGIAAAQVFAQVVATVREAGIPHYRRTHVGHGIGIAGAGYDEPRLAPGDATQLETGMVLCVETPYYEYGFGGLQLEDMVVVTETGCRSLTRLPHRLEQLA